MVPATSTAHRTTASAARSLRPDAGMRLRGVSSPSWKALSSSTASQTRGVVARKWIATVHHSSLASTVIPPITACSTTPPGMVQASFTSRLRSGWSIWTRHAVMTAIAATTTTTPVSIRLPNSIHWLSAWMPGWFTGTRLPATHCGQVGQPRPDPVTRTTEPVTPISACATTAAIPTPRCTAAEGYGKRAMRAWREGTSGEYS